MGLTRTIASQLWGQVVLAAEMDTRAVTTGLFIQSLDDLFDASDKRQAAFNRHVAEIVLFNEYFGRMMVWRPNLPIKGCDITWIAGGPQCLGAEKQSALRRMTERYLHPASESLRQVVDRLPAVRNSVHSGMRRQEQRLQVADLVGGWYRDRTCDPCRVKAVLYR